MLTFGISALSGGILASVFGNRPLFFLSAFFFAISIIVAFLFKDVASSKNLIEKHHLLHLKEALVFSYKHPLVRHFILFFGFFGAFAYMLYYLIQPYFNEGSNAKIIVGIAVTGYFVFCALGSFFSEHVISRIKPQKLVLAILLLSGMIFLLIPFAGLWLGILLVFVHSFMAGVAGVLAYTQINDATASHHRATVLSVLNFFQKILYAVAAPFIGVVADVYSLNVAFLMVGVVLVVVGLVMGVIWIFRKYFGEYLLVNSKLY
jgi:predicted MFS family arabinose efflux permease